LADELKAAEFPYMPSRFQAGSKKEEIKIDGTLATPWGC
jgi:hypothetical protein